MSGCAIRAVLGGGKLYLSDHESGDQRTNRQPKHAYGDRGGRLAEFCIAFSPNARFVPANVVLGFDCTSTDAASSNPGL
jgi:hypothetical protein